MKHALLTAGIALTVALTSASGSRLFAFDAGCSAFGAGFSAFGADCSASDAALSASGSDLSDSDELLVLSDLGDCIDPRIAAINFNMLDEVDDQHFLDGVAEDSVAVGSNGLDNNADYDLADDSLEWANDTVLETFVEPVEVPSFYEHTYPTTWYYNQMCAWKHRVEEFTTDELAWKNCFKAAQYVIHDEEAFPDEVYELLDEMSEYIPDSYTYNLARYSMADLCSEEESLYAEKALSMLPADVSSEELSTWLLYYFSRYDLEGLKRIAQLIDKRGGYPEEVMAYAYNALNSMEKNGIYVSSSVIDLCPKLVIIYGRGEHTDKVILDFGWMDNEHYCTPIFDFYKAGRVPSGSSEHLAVNAVAPTVNAVANLNAFAKATKRPVYVAMASQQIVECCGPVVNEGLLGKCAKKAKMDLKKLTKNWQEVYRTDFLVQPLRDDAWDAEREFRRQMAAVALDWYEVVAPKNPALADKLQECMDYYVNNVYVEENEEPDIDMDELNDALDELAEAFKEFLKDYEENKVTGKDDRNDAEDEELSEGDLQFLFMLALAAERAGIEADEDAYAAFLKMMHEAFDEDEDGIEPSNE